jgi:hypothetical protein
MGGHLYSAVATDGDAYIPMIKFAASRPAQSTRDAATRSTA